MDAHSQVIVAHMLTNQQNDAPMLMPMLARIKANLGRNPKELSADSGYCSEQNLKALARRRICGYVATGRQQHGASSPRTKRRALGKWTVQMRRKLARGGFRSRYRLRKQIVEPVFGQIKSALGFARLLLRGVVNVAHEWALVCMAHNLRKLLLGRPPLSLGR